MASTSRNFSRQALLDGIPYREYWGEHVTPDATSDKDAEAPSRYPVLRAEDEEEVERLFQRLKSVGHFESKNSDEK